MTDPKTSIDVVSDFDGVMLAQFRDAENINKLKEIILRPLQDTADLCAYILSKTSIWDTDRLAEGVMLDFCGSVIGYPRPDAQEDAEHILVFSTDSTEEDLSFGSQCVGDDLTDDFCGYATTTTGQVSVTNPGAKASDEDYLIFVRAKAAAFGQKPTRSNMWAFLNSLGARCTITNPAVKNIQMEPLDYRMADYYKMSYVIEKGLNPTACKILFSEDCDVYNGVYFDSQI